MTTTPTETQQDVRPFQRVSLAAREPRPALRYTYRGVPPPPNGWRVSEQRMAELDAAGVLELPTRPGGTIHLKRYADPERGCNVFPSGVSQ